MNTPAVNTKEPPAQNLWDLILGKVPGTSIVHGDKTYRVDIAEDGRHYPSLIPKLKLIAA